MNDPFNPQQPPQPQQGYQNVPQLPPQQPQQQAPNVMPDVPGFDDVVGRVDHQQAQAGQFNQDPQFQQPIPQQQPPYSSPQEPNQYWQNAQPQAEPQQQFMQQPGQQQQPEQQQGYTQQQVLDMRQELANRNYDVSEFGSNAEIVDAFEQMMVERDRLRQLEQENQYYRQQAYQQQNQTAPQTDETPSTEPEPKVSAWNPPSISEQAKRVASAGLVKMNPQTGFYEAENPMFQQYAQEFNNAAEWKKDRADKFWSNPVEFLKEAGAEEAFRQGIPNEEEILSKAEQRVFEKLQQQRSLDAIEGFLQQNIGLFYQVDQQGRPQRNQAGQMITTDIGRVYQQAAAEAANFYQIADPTRRHSYAMQRVAPMIQQLAASQQQNTAGPQQQQQPQPEPQQDLRRQQQQQFMQNVQRDGQPYRTPQQNTSIAEAATSAAQEFNFEDAWAHSQQAVLANGRF